MKNIKNHNKKFKDSNYFFNVFDENDDPLNESDIHVGTETKEFIEYKVKNLSMTQNDCFTIIDSPGYSGVIDSQRIANKAIEYINEKVNFLNYQE